MTVSDIIRRRRAIFPKFYLPEHPVERSVLEQLLENANWAPTHKLTEPWRFHVFHSSESRRQLADYLADYYQRTTPPEAFSEEKMLKMAENPLRSGAVIAIVLHRDPQESVPEFEEVAAVAMAVQNMWLTCAELNLGCYWSTPPAALDAGELLGLQPNERCLGFFYIGHHNAPALVGKRRPIAEKVRWH
jgi:nitroreductase